MKHPAIWSQVTVERLTAAYLSMRDTEERADLAKGEWEEAKKLRDGDEAGLLNAIDAAQERHNGGLWSKDTTDALAKLQKCLKRSKDKFDVKDREKRRLEDQAKKLATHVFKLVDDACNGEQLDLPMGARGGKQGEADPEAWMRVQLSDLMGELLAAPWKELGVETVDDAINAHTQKSLDQWLKEGEVEKPQVQHLAEAVASHLGRTDRLDKAPKEWRPMALKPVEKPLGPDDASVPAGGTGRGKEATKPQEAPTGPQSVPPMTELDAKALEVYLGVNTWEEQPAAANGQVSPQSWPFTTWRDAPVAPADPKMHVELGTGQVIMHIHDMADFLDSRNIPTPAAMMSNLDQLILDKRLKDVAAVLGWCLDRCSRMQLHYGASPRFRDALADCWNGGQIGRIRELSPLTAALMEREKHLQENPPTAEEFEGGRGPAQEITVSAGKRGKGGAKGGPPSPRKPERKIRKTAKA